MLYLVVMYHKNYKIIFKLLTQLSIGTASMNRPLTVCGRGDSDIFHLDVTVSSIMLIADNQTKANSLLFLLFRKTIKKIINSKWYIYIKMLYTKS